MKSWTPVVLGLALCTLALAFTLGRGSEPMLLAAPDQQIGTLLWYGFAAAAVICAAITALHPKIIYSGLALLGAFGGVAALFVYLAADFLAVTQVAVYIGGILVLILFAVMLTSRIGVTEITNPTVSLPASLGLATLLLGLLAYALSAAPWRTVRPESVGPSAQALGNAFLSTYLLPFEVASVLLVAVIVGAVVLVRKEVRPDAGGPPDPATDGATSRTASSSPSTSLETP